MRGDGGTGEPAIASFTRRIQPMDARNINYRKWLAITALSLVITAVVELISHSQSFSELCRQAAVSWLGVWIGYELKVKHMAKKGAKHDSDQ